MTEENRLRQEIINKFNIQPHKLTNIKYIDSKEQRKDFINMLKDFINFMRCSLK